MQFYVNSLKTGRAIMIQFKTLIYVFSKKPSEKRALSFKKWIKSNFLKAKKQQYVETT